MLQSAVSLCTSENSAIQKLSIIIITVIIIIHLIIIIVVVVVSDFCVFNLTQCCFTCPQTCCCSHGLQNQREDLEQGGGRNRR